MAYALDKNGNFILKENGAKLSLMYHMNTMMNGISIKNQYILMTMGLSILKIDVLLLKMDINLIMLYQKDN